MQLRDKLLSQFEPDVARQLVRFGKHLSSLDADVVMFLARKSLRLYDLLIRVGAPLIEHVVVSDRLLDMSLEPLKGKRVCLVDDTLILGTTLAKTKKVLQEVGASVTAHVFCLDERWYCKDLIIPDHTAMILSDERLMTFCTAEVRALSLVPLPYLVDFPMTRPFRLKLSEYVGLLNSAEWTAMKLSTTLQEQNQICAFTWFPSDSLLAELGDLFGDSLLRCLDLVKVRGWGRRTRDSWTTQLVPIVTLGPLDEDTLGSLTEHLLRTVLGSTGSEIARLLAFPRARQRLCQFILSAALGHRFLEGVKQRVGRDFRWAFDDVETDRHYGPWLHGEMSALAQSAYSRLLSQNGKSLTTLRRARLPDAVIRWTAESIGVEVQDNRIQVPRGRKKSTNLLSDFTEVFHKIYDNREMPARRKVRELGRTYLDDVSAMTNLSRLEQGIPWQILNDWMARLWSAASSHAVTNTFTLLLDLCNDVGIAVPVTCVNGNVVFRGYRYGEDVKFSDNELGLAYDVADGFLQTSKLPSIPRLTLEKLLALLIKIGASHGFLEVLYGASGTDGICKVGFDLKGARPIFSKGPTQRIERDLWLTDYLLRRDVLQTVASRSKRKGQYVLGIRPSGNYSRSRAPDEAKDLGNLVGLLARSGTGRELVLDEESLILLATCATPSDTTKALQVELGIFRDWFQSGGRTLIANANLDNRESIEKALRTLMASHGYEAAQGARLKFIGYKTNAVESIIKKCERRLSQDGEIYRRKWHSYWQPLEKAKLVAEQKEFDPLMIQIAALCWDIAACLAVVEIAFCYVLYELEAITSTRLNTALSKLQQFSAAMRRVGIDGSGRALRITERFQQISALKQIEFTFDDREVVLQSPRKSPASFAPKIALKYALQELDRLSDDLDAPIDLVEALYAGFGKLADRTDYSHMVYYDIIDSTATTAGRQGKNVEYHRSAVTQLKQYLNRWFDRAMGSAQQRSDEIYCMNGDKKSTNDCKHVFLRGVNARLWCEKTIGALAYAATTFHMCARIYVVPCNFVGTNAYRQGFDLEVKGLRFWEHWSRVMKQAASFEPQPPASASFLLIATEELISTVRLGESLEWSDQKEILVSSEIELLTRETKVRCGELRTVVSPEANNSRTLAT